MDEIIQTIYNFKKDKPYLSNAAITSIILTHYREFISTIMMRYKDVRKYDAIYHFVGTITGKMASIMGKKGVSFLTKEELHSLGSDNGRANGESL